MDAAGVKQAIDDLVEMKGNAFMVASHPASGRVQILNTVGVVGMLPKEHAANLVAYLIMVADLERSDIEPILANQGIPFP